jgi:hypothetical protein
MQGGEIGMNSIAKGILCSIAVIFIVFTMTSCTGEKAPTREPSKPSAEPSRRVEEPPKSIEEPNRTIAAKVNGVAIPMNDLAQEMNAIAPQYIKPGQKKDPKTDEIIRKEALDRLIYRELAVQAAKREGMKAPAGAVAEELKRLKAEMKTEDAFRQKLMKSGITEEELKGRIGKNILVGMITEKEIFGKVTVDLDEARKVYAKRGNSFRGPSGPMTFEQARPLIEMELKTAAVQKREDEWIGELKKTARIEIAP